MNKLFLITLFLILLSLVTASVEINPPIVSIIAFEGENNVSLALNLISESSPQTYEIFTNQHKTFFILPESSVEVSSEGSQISILFLNEDLIPGVYVGKITLLGEKTYVVPVILEVESRSPSFDVATEINSNYDGKLDSSVRIIKLKQNSLGDVSVLYKIYDLQGNTVLEETESLSVSGQLELKKSFLLDHLPEEDYVFSAEIRNEESTATSSFLFSNNRNKEKIVLMPFFFILIGLLVVSFFVLNKIWSKKMKEDHRYWQKKVSRLRDDKKLNREQKIKKMIYQKKLLRKAYTAGYIKKESYLKSLTEIEKIIRSSK